MADIAENHSGPPVSEEGEGVQRLRIDVTGKSLTDLADATDRVAVALAQGYMEGHATGAPNGTSYSFKVTEMEE